MAAPDHPPPTAPPSAVGFHRHTPGRASRVIPWLLAAVAVVQLGLGVGGPFDQPWWSLLWSLSLAVALLQVVLFWRMGTEVAPAGLRVRSARLRGRWLPWAQIGALRMPGRLDPSCTALLVDGQRVELLGLPPEAARALVGSGVVRPEGGTT